MSQRKKSNGSLIREVSQFDNTNWEMPDDYEWFISPETGWIQFGVDMVNVAGLDDEDIWCAIEQLTAERMGLTS